MPEECTPVVEAVEEWRPVVGNDMYDVSNLGRVRSWWSSGGFPRVRVSQPHVLARRPGAHGYTIVSITRPQRRTRTHQIHTLVLEAFIGPCPEGMEACHEDGDRANAALTNLRWDTCKANHADKLRHGTAQRGERNPAARLTADAVREMRRARRDGATLSTLAKRFGVGTSAVWRACRGENWKDVQP